MEQERQQALEGARESVQDLQSQSRGAATQDAGLSVSFAAKYAVPRKGAGPRATASARVRQGLGREEEVNSLRARQHS